MGDEQKPARTVKDMVQALDKVAAGCGVDTLLLMGMKSAPDGENLMKPEMMVTMLVRQAAGMGLMAGLLARFLRRDILDNPMLENMALDDYFERSVAPVKREGR